MSIRTDPLDTLLVPDDATVEEHDIVTDGDVLIGGQSTIEFGVRGRNVMAGERVRFGGSIEATGDCRLDMWCDVAESVLVGQDAYLGERVHIGGRLMVSGDLDIGDDVGIDEGFEANGWIVIRNPMPSIVLLVMYLSHLLRLGEEEAAEEFASEVFDDESDGEPLVVPRGSEVSDDAWRVSTPARIGDDCRLHGNLRAREIDVGRDGLVFGSLRARGDVSVGPGTEIKGDVTTRGGDVHVGPDAVVWGDVAAENVSLHRAATVQGAIRARGETRIHDGPADPEREGVEDVEAEADAEEPEANTDDAEAEETDAVSAEPIDDDSPARLDEGPAGGFEAIRATDDEHESDESAGRAADRTADPPDGERDRAEVSTGPGAEVTDDGNPTGDGDPTGEDTPGAKPRERVETGTGTPLGNGAVASNGAGGRTGGTADGEAGATEMPPDDDADPRTDDGSDRAEAAFEVPREALDGTDPDRAPDTGDGIADSIGASQDADGEATGKGPDGEEATRAATTRPKDGGSPGDAPVDPGPEPSPGSTDETPDATD